MSIVKALFKGIFNYEIICLLFSKSYYKPNNAKLRLLSEEPPLFSFLKSNRFVEEDHPLNFISKLAISLEEVISSIYNLRDNHPRWFKYIENYVAEPLEVSVLLQKKIVMIGYIFLQIRFVVVSFSKCFDWNKDFIYLMKSSST